MTEPYPFTQRIASIYNSGMSRVMVATGNVMDLFYSPELERYTHLLPYLEGKCRAMEKTTLVIWELNGPIRFISPDQQKLVEAAWNRWGGWPKAWPDQESGGEKTFPSLLLDAINSPTLALELLRQLCILSRSKDGEGLFLSQNLVIIIEDADLIIPAGDSFAQLPEKVQRRIKIMRDWLGDPAFHAGNDFLILLAESRSSLNSQVARLPTLLEVRIPLPSTEERRHYIEWFSGTLPAKPSYEGNLDSFSEATAGFMLQTLGQLLRESASRKEVISAQRVTDAIEEQAKRQLGEDVVTFKRPTHTLKDAQGNRLLKKFLSDVLIPAIRSRKHAPSAVTVSGALGAGKTYIYEAVAGELGVPVVVLGNFRSMWFGQSDVIWERLERFLTSFSQVVIFVDEADTAFGGVGPDTHETERRLTGRFHALISDPANRGRITAILMTARVHLLSRDLLRPGRGGDYILPVLDPEGEDKTDFLRWVLAAAGIRKPSPAQLAELATMTTGGYAALFDQYRRRLAAARENRKGKRLTWEQLKNIVQDVVPPPLERVRRYQTLQALLFCTSRSVLTPEQWDLRSNAHAEIRKLEAEGIRGF
ncbi:MAG: ATP-binding protein [Candidatus Aenigmarchaeota archaeon]|nr:ATP-binding protein [Candidatus Aenigmarchaeota archaeon]